jgi:hypothetical protein
VRERGAAEGGVVEGDVVVVEADGRGAAEIADPGPLLLIALLLTLSSEAASRPLTPMPICTLPVITERLIRTRRCCR